MERRNKRDAKFLIFQSLYIIAISILFYKGTDLSLNKVTELKKDEKVVTKAVIDSLTKWPSYDSLKQIVMPKLPDSTVYKKVNLNQEVFNKEILAEKDRKISELERQVARQPQRSVKENKKSSTTDIEGETPK
ncbi:MAG: hypothetical protein SGI89_00090 [bacterium]|nr:hypothetical protein [bacterium]